MRARSFVPVVFKAVLRRHKKAHDRPRAKHMRGGLWIETKAIVVFFHLTDQFLNAHAKRGGCFLEMLTKVLSEFVFSEAKERSELRFKCHINQAIEPWENTRGSETGNTSQEKEPKRSFVRFQDIEENPKLIADVAEEFNIIKRLCQWRIVFVNQDHQRLTFAWLKPNVKLIFRMCDAVRIILIPDTTAVQEPRKLKNDAYARGLSKR